MNNRIAVQVVFCATSLLCVLDAHASSITFDDFLAPSTFARGTALSEEYAAQGVHFQGSGMVLNNYSNFEGVPWTYTRDISNFLAFNSNVGVAPPETILFDNAINFFQWDFAGSSGDAHLTAYLGDTLVGNSSISANFGVWNAMSLNAVAFDKVVFSVSNTDPHFVVDNLIYTPYITTVPLPASLWLLASATLGLFSAAWRRRKQ